LVDLSLELTTLFEFEVFQFRPPTEMHIVKSLVSMHIRTCAPGKNT